MVNSLIVPLLLILIVLMNNDEFFVVAKKKIDDESLNFTDAKNKEQNDTKKDRAALFSQPRIFPFLEQLLNPFGIIPEPLPLGITPIGVGPSHINSLNPGLPSFGPYVGAPKPNCAINGLYCPYDTTYPRDQVNALVNQYYEDIRDMYSSLNRISVKDLIHFDNKTHRYRDGGHFVCESKVQYIRPGWARNLRGEWLAIINTESFPQVVRVEECKYGNRRCEYLPPCYKSSCMQRFSFEKLLCVDPTRPNGKPIVDVFEIPNACSCFVENFVYY